jgi:hypothetical protein
LVDAHAQVHGDVHKGRLDRGRRERRHEGVERDEQ